MSTHQNFHGSEVKPIVDQDSDDSDSEIFRVKRRSSFKVEKRNANDASSVKHFDHQVSSRVLSELNFLICDIGLTCNYLSNVTVSA